MEILFGEARDKKIAMDSGKQLPKKFTKPLCKIPIFENMESNPLNFNLFNSIILAGIIQGFVFGLAVFLSKKYQSPGIKYLVALIVVFSLNNLQYYLQDSGLISSTALYGLCLIGNDGKLPSKTKWALLPRKCFSDFANYTLVAIGLEAGFNSKTTFNAAFKKVTLQTPSEYHSSIAHFETLQNSVA